MNHRPPEHGTGWFSRKLRILRSPLQIRDGKPIGKGRINVASMAISSQWLAHDSRRTVLRLVSWGGIGDALLTTPLLRSIKNHDAKCKVVVLYSNPDHRHVFAHNPYVNRLKAANGWRSPGEAFIRTMGWGKSIVLNYGAYSPSLYYRKSAAEIIAEMAGFMLTDTTPELYLTPREEDHARAIVASDALPVVLHTTAMCSVNKNWQYEKWVQLVARNPKCSFYQIGTVNERLVHGARDMRDRLGLRLSFALIKCARCLITVDSCFAHVASATGTPAVVLFGPTTPVIWGHRGHREIYGALSCSPCGDILRGARCPYGQMCMTQISIKEVDEAFQSALATY